MTLTQALSRMIPGRKGKSLGEQSEESGLPWSERAIPEYTTEEVASALRTPQEHYLEAQVIIDKVDEAELYGTDLGRDLIALANVHALLSQPLRTPGKH